jgi:asparagine synthase (glutamine-hydrolysing)
MSRDGQRLDTFSVDYEDNDRYFTAGKFQPDSDNAYIGLMQETLETAHHWSVLKPDTLLSHLGNATLARDLPGMADVDFSLLAFCGDIRKHVKVALSGECADEIFGGYPWYRDPQVRSCDGFPWSQTTRERLELAARELSAKIDGEAFVHEQYEATLHQSDILPENDALETRMKQMVNLNFRWFMQTLLDRKDRMSMFNSLEVRVPFCDYRIAEYMYAVPWSFKDHLGREKGLLRWAVKDLLPEQVLYRKKSPYPKTHHPRYTMLVRERFLSLLENRDIALYRLFSRKALREFADSGSRWPWYGQLMTYPQTMAYILQVHQWLEHYQIELLY